MIQPGQYDIYADRWVACSRTFTLLGVDLTGASFASQIRQVSDLGGTAMVTLGVGASATVDGIRLLYGGTDIITNHITAGRLASVPEGYLSSTSVAISQLAYFITAVTMATLPLPAERGTNTNLAWDITITPSGGVKDKYLGGAFIVRPGVSQ